MSPQGKIIHRPKEHILGRPVLSLFTKVTDDLSVAKSNGQRVVYLSAVSNHVDHSLLETLLSLNSNNFPISHLTTLIFSQPVLLANPLLYHLQASQ